MSYPQDEPPDPEDTKILKHAGNLMRQLGLSKPVPDAVLWVDDAPPDSVLVQFGEIKLPRSMRGKVTAENWRPLLSSSMVYHYLLEPKRIRGSLLRVALPLALGELLLVYVLLRILTPGNADLSLDLWVTVSIWIAYTLFLMATYANWGWRILSYAADTRAAELVGKETMLQALTSFRNAQSQEAVSTRQRGIRPSLDQRVKRLQKQLG